MKIEFRCDPNLIDRLPRPVPAREGLPEWLRRMPADALSSTHGTSVRTVKQCPPFVDAMTHGFLMTLPCDVTVAGGRFSWSWDLAPLTVDRHPRAPLSFHVPEQLSGTSLGTGGRAAIKFNSFWTIRLDPGYSLFATHPVNRLDLPFRTLSGMVDSDRFHEVGILFPAIWEDDTFEGILPAGTPLAQCFPVERVALDLDCGAFSREEALAYDETAGDLLGEPGVYRKRYRGKRPSSQR